MAELEQVFGVPVIEAYGMTEAAHQMTSNPLPPGVRKPGSVGRPAGPEIAILSESGALLAVGEVGEVAIKGPNVMTGYRQNVRPMAGFYAEVVSDRGSRLSGSGRLPLSHRPVERTDQSRGRKNCSCGN